MENKLKSCPFCGITPTLIIKENWENQIEHQNNGCSLSMEFWPLSVWNTRRAEGKGLVELDRERLEEIQEILHDSGKDFTGKYRKIIQDIIEFGVPEKGGEKA